MRLLLLQFMVCFPLISFGAGKVSCICQIGLEPSYQRGFFKKGCEKWLEEQTDCWDRKVIDQSTDEGALPLEAAVAEGLLKLGYVGHWGSALQSYAYFQKTIKPTMMKYRVGVFWDNTACKGLDHPESFLSNIEFERKFAILQRNNDIEANNLQERFAKLLNTTPRYRPVRELPFWMTATLVYRANQTTSIGMWDRYIGGASVNFWAVVNVQNSSITIPKCREFLDKICLATQKGETGSCSMQENEQKKLVCCPYTSPSQEGSPTFYWTLGETCPRGGY